MPENKLNPFALALGATALGGALAGPAALAADDPFRITELSRGYMVADSHGGAEDGEKEPCPRDDDAAPAEGQCGEGKCGEGKCGGDGDKPAEGQCGEGKCGGDG